jgi:Xaa-Pro aminopeptidase
MKQARLKEIEWPEFGKDVSPVHFTIDELLERIAKTRAMMVKENLTHLVVYGDREHFGNLTYLVNYEPRFEEALLILDLQNDPLILVGNENGNRFKASPLYTGGKMRYELYQPFSLLNQPKESSRQLKDIFSSEGINSQSRIGCAGWKYFSEIEHHTPDFAIEIPSFIVDTLREVSKFENVVNATHIFMHPGTGLRSKCSASEIALFEFSSVMASEGMRNLLLNIKVGKTDFELIKYYNYNGYPLNCNTGMTCGTNRHIGLANPEGYTIKKGDPFSTNLGYWGSNSCRAGWVAANDDDLPEHAKGYVNNFAGPYFAAMGEWYKNMKIGVKGKVIEKLIADLLPFDKFGIFLNPGHLIHYDEWLSSPIYKGSEIEIQSGMYFQVDVIPKSKKYFSTRMEDGIVIADASLRSELKAEYPAVYNRCMDRRKFMTDVLGFELPDEILPLSNIPAIVPPFFLNPKMIFTLE